MKGLIVRLSIFVAVCTFFAGLLAFSIGNINYRDPLDRDTYKVSALFDDVSGLLPNDNVKIAGVVVGKVSAIKLVEGKAKITMKLRNSHRLPSDTSAAIRWRNLLGQRFVYLYPGSSPTRLAKGATITDTRSVVDLGELFNRLGPIVKAIDPQQVNTFLDSIVQALDGNEGALRSAVADLGTVTTAIAQRDQAIGRILDNLSTLSEAIVNRDAQIRQTLDNLVTLAATFSDNTATIDRAIQGVRTISGDLADVLRSNASHVDSIIGNLLVVVRTVQSKLPEVGAALPSIDRFATSLFRASRYGEWLNQVIPCGRVSAGPLGSATVDCNVIRNVDGVGLPDLGGILGPSTGASPSGALDVALPPAGTAAQAATITAPGATTPGRTTTGAAAIAQLLGVPLQPAGTR